MASNPDPYRTLGLPRGASLDEVKRAYRRLAKVNHPDAAGPAALPRFLAIQAAYEQLVDGAGGPDGGGGPGGPRGAGRPGQGARPGPATRRRPSTADPYRADGTRRAYGGGSGGARSDATPGAAARSRHAADEPGGGAGQDGRRDSQDGRRDSRDGRRDYAGPDPGRDRGPTKPPGERTRSGAARGKATLGSTSYDGADGGPFEPDWGGASWYGTTSGTYWTINPKEYADPRKHGPEYQARARRAAGTRGASPDGGREPGPGPAAAPRHTTSSWWESTSGPDATTNGPQPSAERHPGWTASPDGMDDRPAAGAGPEAGAGTLAGAATLASAGEARARVRHDVARDQDPAQDPASAAVGLWRALTDPRSGRLRGRVLRAILGWLPIALGLGWLVGELTGCGRFAATCDPSVAPLLAVGQGIVLASLLLLPEIAAITAGGALVLLAAAVAASLILSATGAAADEGSRRAALGALLVVAWLTGLAVAVVRRIRAGPRSAGPVS